MAFLNNILSSWKGKRLNSDAFPDHDRYMKKQRHATNGPAQVGLPSRVDSETKETRCKVNKMIMLYVQNQSHVEAPGADGGPPKAQLTQNIFATVLIDNVMDSLHGHARHEQQLWSLGAFLFSDPQMDRQITQSIASPQQRRLKNWIRATVIEETDLLGGGPMLGAAAADDGWARCFHYMSTGKVVQAAELAQKLGDDALMAMLVIHYQQDDTPLDIHKAAEEQIDYWRAENAFDAFHLDRKRMWYVLQGKLGYVDELKMVITHDLAWPQALLLYTLYGDRYGHLPSALARYEALVRDQHILSPHTLRAKKETQPVPQHCQWYRLLLWWAIAIAPDAFSQQETAIQPAIETSFPLRFRWLLMLHVKNMLKHPNKDNWTADWCDQLFNDGMEYMAMHAALYMTNSEPWIKDKLSKRTWDKEHYLIRQLQIPAAWIIEAKAVYAHNQGQFDDEISRAPLF
ncbi:nuclear protein 96-domain-containing protein [Gongronella butleri]|nr:nuclear protein 96-domain-containing protein [Gongronella butleri]